MNDNELRDRIAAIVDKADSDAAGEEGGLALAMSKDIAQAIIDDLGLHYVDSEEYAKVGLDWLEVEEGRHVVGRWEGA